MTTWLFRGNPRDFDMNAYLQPHRDLQWHVRQHLLMPEMHVGDRVFLWRSNGDMPGTAGIVARGSLVGTVLIRPHSDFVTWLRRKPDPSIPTVLIRLDDIRLTARAGCLLRSELVQDAILRNLEIISKPTLTSCKLSAVQQERLEQVWEARRVRDL
jgi:hypothetical protein